MLTGRVPFEGETVHEVLMKHLTAQPDLSMLPEPYRAIVGRALAKDPNRRPQRAVDLLVPGDAPPPPDVRFIGDGKSSPAADLERIAGATPAADPPKAPASAEPPKEEILHIGEEDSVFYIGPNTVPPRRRASSTIQHWLWGTRPAPAPRRRGPAPAPQARRVADGPRRPATPARRPAAPPRPAPAPTPPAPAAPPQLPGGRVRLAELATSMLLAAPLAALLSLPTAAALGIDLSGSPDQAAGLFGLALLGAWGVLMPAKLWEGRSVDAATRRFTMGAVGVALGSLMVALTAWTGLDLPAAGWGPAGSDLVRFWTISLGAEPRTVGVLGLVGYFGAAFVAGPWMNLTARNRKARFRFWPIAWSGLLAAALGLAIPAPQPWGIGLLLLVATVAQAVSPWSREAARYARRPRLSAA